MWQQREVRWYMPRGMKSTSPGARITSSTGSVSSDSGQHSSLPTLVVTESPTLEAQRAPALAPFTEG